MSPRARTTNVLIVALIAAAVATTVPPAAGAAPGAAKVPWRTSIQRTVPGEVVVTFRAGTPASSIRHTHRRAGVVGRTRVADGRRAVFVVDTGAGSVAATIRRYEADPDVFAAEPNRIATPSVIPTDVRFAQQWGMHNTGQRHRITDYDLDGTVRQRGAADADVDAPEAWDVTTGANDVVIAVIDSGVDIDHEELDDSLWINTLEESGFGGTDDDGNGYVDDVHGYDFRGEDADPSPPATFAASHGTHVAGIIAAEQDDFQVTGICPECRIMPLRIDLSLGQEIEAIEYAVDNGADVINMSFGGPVWSPGERAAIAAAGEAGVLTVVSAGNSSLDNDIAVYPARSNDFAPGFPASYDLPTVLSVAASDDHDRYGAISQCRFAGIPRWRCAFTSWGHDAVDVAAPGVDILSTIVSGLGFPYDGLDTWDGTSMAAPMVAGIAGLVKSANPAYTPVEIKNAIMNSVDTPGSLKMLSGWADILRLPRHPMDGDFTRTQGRVNAVAALTAPTTDATPLTDGNIGGAVPMGANASGRVTWPHDTNDVWAVTLDEDVTYTITLDGPRRHDLDLWVWSPSAVEIHQFTAGCFRRRGSCPALRDLSASPTGEERVEFRARTGGTYFVQVNGWYDGARYDLKVRT